jgi:tetrapyrrole methylase family protein/MazG family protein
LSNTIEVVGLGPGGLNQMTLETWEMISRAKRLILRTSTHPAAQELQAKGIVFETCDHYYETHSNFESVYGAIARRLIREAHGMAAEDILVYAVPGHPQMAERSVALLLEQTAGLPVQVNIHTAMSFLDPVITLLELDPTDKGLAVLDALNPPSPLPTQMGCLYVQIYNQWAASELKLTLLEHYPDRHPVTWIRSAGVPGLQKSMCMPLYALDHQNLFDHLTSVYVPPYVVPSEKTWPCQPKDQAYGCKYPLDPLTDIMERLLAPDGCPWDREQTFQTMKEPLINEAYEVVEALDLEDMDKLMEELGDLLLQIVFNTALAMKRHAFDHNDVVTGITQKMIRRHPHVFGTESLHTAQEVLLQWDIIKSTEKGRETKERVMQDLNRSLPALLYAYEVQRKARKVGFDRNHVQNPLDRIAEEFETLKHAIATGQGTHEALGNLLFEMVNLSRFLNASPEAALMNANQRFLRRFSKMEGLLQDQGLKWNDMEIKALNDLWEKSKTE